MHYTDQEEFDRGQASAFDAHRDDYYIFFVIEKGSVVLMIDFEEVRITEKHVYYILPGQVHYMIGNAHVRGWFIAVDTILIPKEFRAVFEASLILQQPCEMVSGHYRKCLTLLGLLFEQYKEEQRGTFYLQLLYSLLNSFLGMAADLYTTGNERVKPASRPFQIAQEFKLVLTEKLRTEKSPSAYAGYLNISESYLNESLKKVTGFSVSYWIIQEVMLEAKRLLYYSQLNVKEIAHQLGYEDHTYFSRLFKKANGITALDFRARYRK
jgi:AraC family transcriptional activator of pobA